VPYLKASLAAQFKISPEKFIFHFKFIVNALVYL
jgi:hypothetical protein